MCFMILEKMFGPPKRLRHMYSSKYVSKSFECIVLSSRIIRLHELHIDSIPCVYTPVTGSTKCSEWLTVWCLKPTLAWSWLYAPHSSLYTMLPRRICAAISGGSVSASLCCTSTRKHSFNSSKNPVAINLSSSVVFSLSKFTFIYLNFYARPSDDSWMVYKILRTNITNEVIPQSTAVADDICENYMYSKGKKCRYKIDVDPYTKFRSHLPDCCLCRP